MKNLIKSKMFFVGFIIGAILFVALNLLSDSTTSYYVHQYGFPFSFHEWKLGDSISQVGNLPLYEYETIIVDRFIWIGFIGNIFVTVIFSFVVGLVFKFVWSKIVSRRLHLK